MSRGLFSLTPGAAWRVLAVGFRPSAARLSCLDPWPSTLDPRPVALFQAQARRRLAPRCWRYAGHRARAPEANCRSGDRRSQARSSTLLIPHARRSMARVRRGPQAQRRAAQAVLGERRRPPLIQHGLQPAARASPAAAAGASPAATGAARRSPPGLSCPFFLIRSPRHLHEYSCGAHEYSCRQ
jgi:hypothetical protein